MFLRKRKSCIWFDIQGLNGLTEVKFFVKTIKKNVLLILLTQVLFKVRIDIKIQY